MNILDLADARLYLDRHRRPYWTVRETAYGAMAILDRRGDALAFIAWKDIDMVSKYVVNTRKGAISIRSTLPSALDFVLNENRREP